MTELEPRLSEADAQKVLARATELQAQQSGTLSIAQVREIAAEMSIPESALDQALMEHRDVTSLNSHSSPVAPQSFWRQQRETNRLVFMMALFGGAFALLLGTSVVVRLFP